MSKETTAVAVTAKASIAGYDDDALYALAADAGQGLDETTAADFSIPFLRVIQSLSPQLSKKDKEYIPNAKAGDFFNTVTREVFDGETGILVVVSHYKTVYNEWRPRELNGGGFIRSYETREDANEQAKPEHDIVDTGTFYILHEQKDTTLTPAVLTLKGSQRKIGRDWLSTINSRVIKINEKVIKPATYAYVFRLTTEEMSNEKGRWFSLKVNDAGALHPKSQSYADAKEFYSSVKSGKKKVNFAAEEGEAKKGDTVDAEVVVDESNPKF